MMADTAGSLAHSTAAVVPDLQGASNNEPMAYLKAHLEGLRPLGFVSVDPGEFLVIYNGMFSSC